ncbi:MAG: type II toxin-antitoxin system VapC family toxin [Alphaproteobacteria bacterium]|nr:type II toxin-antitoxin system VapC family toxin [Alphaproteobacteria bacterium]
MFIDTSAFVEILARLPEAGLFESILEEHAELYTSALVRLETVMALSRFDRGTPHKNQQAFDAVVEAAGIQFVDLDDAVGRIAVDAFARFGKGQRHRAQLNLSDCMSYAAARHYQLPLLCKGADFALTDVDVVPLPQR